MGTFVITGSASGIGRETAAMLRAGGHAVIGVDLRDAEVEADLGTPGGRDAMVHGCETLAPDGIDGVVAAAGIANPNRGLDEISVNYFGARATAEGLRPLLSRSARPRVVMVASTAALHPFRADVVSACLEDNEARARDLVTKSQGGAYCDSKRAISLWMRREAAKPAWGGAGIALNGVAPGIVVTPMTRDALADPETAKLFEQGSPSVLEGYAKPRDLAEVIIFLLMMEGGRMLGQMLYVDGGADALLRPGIV